MCPVSLRHVTILIFAGILSIYFSFVIFSWVVCTFRSALDGECGFLAANLYAKSVFGEDALVNVSIEKQADGKLSGYIRIRSKTQGIALSLGDKITLKQKGGR
jgi:hypothetical protein